MSGSRRKMRKRRDEGQKTTRHTKCVRRVATAAPGLVCQRKSSTPCLQAHHHHSFSGSVRVICVHFRENSCNLLCDNQDFNS